MPSLNCKKSSIYKIVFLNQMAGPLFRELAEDLSCKWQPNLLYTGHVDTLQHANKNIGLHILRAPSYDRSSLLTRSVSWIYYFIASLYQVWSRPNKSLIFIVSNPPFLGILGAFFMLVRKQKYVILIYDIYPDLLINIGRIKDGVIAGIWRFFNRFILHHAALIITIGHDMVALLNQSYPSLQQLGKQVLCIQPWADLATIHPIQKTNNPFVRTHKLENKTTVLYSGNMGHSHDIEIIIKAAERLIAYAEIQFVIIGEGAKFDMLQTVVNSGKFKNLLLLPFQTETVLPFSMASADIGIITYQKGSEGCILPSKIFYYMAAGAAPIVISSIETDLTEMVIAANCGLWIRGGDDAALAAAILILHKDSDRLNDMKMKARMTAVRNYSRNNTKQFESALRGIIESDQETFL